MGYRPIATTSGLAAFAAAGGCFQARTLAIFWGSMEVSGYMIVLWLPLQTRNLGDWVEQSRMVGREARCGLFGESLWVVRPYIRRKRKSRSCTCTNMKLEAAVKRARKFDSERRTGVYRGQQMRRPSGSNISNRLLTLGDRPLDVIIFLQPS
jgi:hypothetical protein